MFSFVFAELASAGNRRVDSIVTLWSTRFKTSKISLERQCIAETTKLWASEETHVTIQLSSDHHHEVPLVP